MKALIIDDERHVREGVILLGEWSKFGINTILEAEDGDEAIQLINKHRPEIIFTDMRMPKRDGMSLLKWLKEAELTCKTIVISGYDDFNYMRNAIQNNSFDYILKPIEPDALNGTLEKAIKEWREQKKSQLETAMALNEAKLLYWDRLFSKAIKGSSLSKENLTKIVCEFDRPILNERLTAAIISAYRPIVDKDGQNHSTKIIEKCNEILSMNKAGIAFRNVDKAEEVIVLFWKKDCVKYFIERILGNIRHSLELNCRIFVGDEAANALQAYQAAQFVQKKQNLLDWKTIYYDRDIKQTPIFNLLDYAQELKWAIQSGSTEQVDQILMTIFDLFENDSYIMTNEQLENWESQFELLKQTWLQEYKRTNLKNLYKGIHYWKKDKAFSFELFKEEKRKEFHDVIRVLQSLHYQKEKSIIHQIEEYIRENYQKELQLQEMADRFFLSREYISRQFKKEFSCNITDYLMKIRMQKAKELLENPYLKIYDIAFQVGYQNEKYFSKVFKKYFGMTPNDYRCSHLQKS